MEFLFIKCRLFARSFTFLFLLLLCAHPLGAEEGGLQVGVHAVNVTPPGYPVRVNGMFVEREATEAIDPLMARCFVLKQGRTQVALVVVDTCMMPRDLIDQAKELASTQTGIPAESMLISATHTHSAPAAMGCLGSRADPEYAMFLPGKIAEAIIFAAGKVQPARAGWAVVEDWEHTFCRRWIRRPDKLIADPFGDLNGRAHMHPGYESPDAIGPSGPVDPDLSLLAFESLDGKPMGLLANYSQHYYGSPLLSSDYFGRFALHFERLAGIANAHSNFLAAMSQGTSGDQMWMNYGEPQKEIGYDAYAKELAEKAVQAWRKIEFKERVPLEMKETRLRLRFRVPDENRLAWARATVDALQGRLPQTLPEIYAMEALELHARPTAELKVQALRIGDLGLTALPNEVFALTGLRIKAQSPLRHTFNIELANGAEGYIPPPAQHALGGYTTWPARTAGLEVNAEPRLVETVLQLLEEVSGKKRRPLSIQNGPYARAVLKGNPSAYWRLEDWGPSGLEDSSGNGRLAKVQGKAAWRLTGPDGNIAADGEASAPPKKPNRFSGSRINSAVHLAGGRMESELPRLGSRFSIAFWFWNGLAPEVREISGNLFSVYSAAGPTSHATVGLRGTANAGNKLYFTRNGVTHHGGAIIPDRSWQFLAVTREKDSWKIFLNGQLEMEASLPGNIPGEFWKFIFGGEAAGAFHLEGKLDEVAVFPQALSSSQIKKLFQSSGYPEGAGRSRVISGISPPPLPAEESMKQIQLLRGFEVELVASEPLVASPVAIDWDLAGRLWVVEMIDYPLGIDGKGKPGGRIRILEDTNSDGTYDTSRIFAEGLKFPTGVLTWKGGALVTAAPDILFLQDTNGDGKADKQEVVITGFLEGNQQLRVNGLRWGLDSWIYCANGSPNPAYGTETRLRSPRTGKELLLGSRDFRFRPDTGEMEALSGPSQYGRNRDDWGHWFGVQNSWPLWHYVLEEPYLARNPHLTVESTRHQLLTPANPKVYPVAPQEKRFHSFNQAGHFTSACSAMIYRDTLLFGNGPGRHAFVCEPFHNLVQHVELVEEGVTFTARRSPLETEREFLASKDRWFRPVMVRTGPDGALWVVDMYRYMIEHPEWLPEEGRKELLPHYRAGEDRGRIYRIYPKGRRLHRFPKFSRGSSEFVEQFDHSNGWIRDKAMQSLVERGDQSALPALQKKLKSSKPLARLHALWTLEALGRLSKEAIQSALEDSDSEVRRAALRLAEKEKQGEVVQAAMKLARDSDPKVRLQLALSAGYWTHPRLGNVLAHLAIEDPKNDYLRGAILSSVLSHLQSFSSEVRLSKKAREFYEEPLLKIFIATKNREVLGQWLEDGLSSEPDSEISPEEIRTLSSFIGLLQKRGETLQGWEVENDLLSKVIRRIPPLFELAGKIAQNQNEIPQNRAAALQLLQKGPAHRKQTIEIATSWLEPHQTPVLQEAGMRAVAATGGTDASAILLDRWKEFSPNIRRQAVQHLLSREAWALALLTRMGAGGMPASVLDVSQRARLLQHGSPRIQQAAQKVLGGEGLSARQEVLDQFRPALQLKGNRDRGMAVFNRSCASCHRLNGVGSDIGPDLGSVASHAPEKLLVSILDPNASIEPGYLAYECGLANEEEVYGIIVGESANSIILKTSQGEVRTLLRSEIRKLRLTDLSLMPEGLEVGMTPQDLADLISAIRN